jgi:integrase/recombinase XerC
MTTHTHPANPGQAELDAARLLLARMGIDPTDLLTGATTRPPAPTFAEYIPVVSAAVSDASRRAYSSYWKKIANEWGERRLDEPTPSQIKQLGEKIRATVTVRSNSRGGNSAVENFITALRCLYNQAVADSIISGADNPASKVAKPRRLKSTRHAVPDARLAEINEVAATTGDDPALDTLLLRLHIETAW